MNTKNCIICRFSKFKILSSRVRDSPKHHILKCMKCGHVQIFPVPTINEDKKFYDEDRQSKNINYFKSISELKLKTREDTQRRVNLVKSITKRHGTILEIGSGYGFFLNIMKKHGYKIIGIEISKERRKISKKITNVKVLDTDLSQSILPITKFDSIVLFHVLEHLVDPINFLKNLSNMLNPNGTIIVEVPNLNDFQLKLNKTYANWYWQRAHIHYFSPKILKRVFFSAGFDNNEIIGVQRYSVENFFSWKLTNKPQLNDPTMNLSYEYDWIEKSYKRHLEQNLKCDTLVAIGKFTGKKD